MRSNTFARWHQLPYPSFFSSSLGCNLLFSCFRFTSDRKRILLSPVTCLLLPERLLGRDNSRAKLRDPCWFSA